jgi:hypothetical protein
MGNAIIGFYFGSIADIGFVEDMGYLEILVLYKIPLGIRPCIDHKKSTSYTFVLLSCPVGVSKYD